MPRNFATLGFIPATLVEGWTISSRKGPLFLSKNSPTPVSNQGLYVLGARLRRKITSREPETFWGVFIRNKIEV